MTRDLKSNPLRKGGCGRNDCMVCTKGGKGDCSRSGAGYEISCLECPKVKITAEYEGETARNPYSRGLEHGKDLEKESEPIMEALQHLARRQKSEFQDGCIKIFQMSYGEAGE